MTLQTTILFSSCWSWASNVHPCLFHIIVFPSLLLYTTPSSFFLHCVLQYCLWCGRRRWDVSFSWPKSVMRHILRWLLGAFCKHGPCKCSLTLCSIWFQRPVFVSVTLLWRSMTGIQKYRYDKVGDLHLSVSVCLIMGKFWYLWTML